MPGIDQSTLRNRLLSTLPPDDFALVAGHLDAFEVCRGESLVEFDAVTDSAWFFDTGVGSMIAISLEGHRVETGLFGREGFAPAPLALGIDRMPYQVLIQVPGTGHRIGAAALGDLMARSPALRVALGRYLQTLGTQIAYTALSNAVHQIDERCARWLLMVHDRVDGDDIQLTHEFLSLMLAVRRPSVTTALHVLEGNGLIRADRGWVTIRNRAGLEEFAADAYGRSETEYRRLLGPMA